MKKSIPRRCAKRWRLALLAVWLIGYCGLTGEQSVAAEESAPKSKVEQGATEQQPSQPAPLPTTIEGFRQARFGMNEEQVRQVIRKDFPTAKISDAIHPSEKTMVLSFTVADLLPNTGNARVSYIFGYRSKKLIQINIVWASDGSAVSDETVVGTANSLRDYFASQNYKPDSAVANRQLAENTIVVFRANDLQGRTVLLVLSGAARRKRGRGRRCSYSSSPTSRTPRIPTCSVSARVSSSDATCPAEVRGGCCVGRRRANRRADARRKATWVAAGGAGRRRRRP